MKKRYIITALLLLAGFSKISAQQLPLYSNYYLTPFIYNPSQSGTDGSSELTFLHRRQWTDIQGSPETSALAINGSLNEEKVGWSVYAYRDVTDIVSRMGIYGNYAYHLKLADNTTLSFGLGAGYLNNAIDQSAIRSKDIESIITVTTDNRGNFDLNTGVSLKLADFSLGVAIPQILNPSIEYTQNTTEPINYSLIRHYVINAGYDFRFKGQENILTPLVMIKAAQNVPVQIDVGAIFNLKDYGYLGAMYRSDYAVTANVGLNLTDALTLGYAYDFSTNTFASNLGTSHEFMLRYSFGSDKKMDRLEREQKKLKKDQRKLKDQIEEEMDERMAEKLGDLEKELQKKIDEAEEKLKNIPTGTNPDQSGDPNQGRTQNPRTNRDPNQNGDPNQGVDPNQNRDPNQTYDPNQNDNSYSPRNQPQNVEPGSNGYYVVAGVFGSQANAQKLVNKLGGQGMSARYFQDKGNFYYYVYLLKFNTYQEAERAKNSKMNGAYSGDLWIKIVE